MNLLVNTLSGWMAKHTCGSEVAPIVLTRINMYKN